MCREAVKFISWKADTERTQGVVIGQENGLAEATDKGH